MSAACGNNETVTITDSAQATALSTCTTYNGSIAVGGSFSGDLALDGIGTVTGALSVDHVQALNSFSAPSVHTVGTLYINSSGLTELSLPALQVVNNKVEILGTLLQSLDLSMLEATTFVSIQNNTDLTEINISKLAEADEIIVVENGDGRLKLDLAGVNWVTHLWIGDCSSVNLSSLQSTGDMNFRENTFTTLSLPALITVLGGLIVHNNSNLTSISAPVLAKIELPDDATDENVALAISSNTALTGTIDLPAILEIKHNADIDGAFSNFLLPALTKFNGNLTIESTKDIASTCVHFEDISRASSNLDFGAVTCKYPATHGSSNRVRAIAGGIGGAVAFFVILGLLFVGVTFQRIRRKGTGKGRRAVLVRGEDGMELPDYGSLSRGN